MQAQVPASDRSVLGRFFDWWLTTLAEAMPGDVLLWPHFMGTAIGQMAALSISAAVGDASVCEVDVNDNGTTAAVRAIKKQTVSYMWLRERCGKSIGPLESIGPL